MLKVPSFNLNILPQQGFEELFIVMATEPKGVSVNGTNGHSPAPPNLRREPLKSSGSIDYLEYVDVTPIIGREYPTAKIKDILTAPNSDQQLRDLAITICERGVGKYFSTISCLVRGRNVTYQLFLPLNNHKVLVTYLE